jgi:hypothetical protein
MPKPRSKYLYSTTVTFTKRSGTIAVKTTKFPILSYPEENEEGVYVYNIMHMDTDKVDRFLKKIEPKLLNRKNTMAVSEDPAHQWFCIHYYSLHKPSNHTKSKIIVFLAQKLQERATVLQNAADEARAIAAELRR